MGTRYNPDAQHQAARPSTGNHSWCDEVLRLIGDGCYERVAELLEEYQTSIPKNEYTQYDSILAAARTICLACEQCRAEVEGQRQVIQATEQRERELRGQLCDVLQSINVLPTTQEPSQSDSFTDDIGEEKRSSRDSVNIHEERPGFWKRVQSMLGFGEVIQTPSKPLQERVVQTQTRSAMKIIRNKSSEEEKYARHDSPSLVAYCQGSFRVFQNEKLISQWNGVKSQSIFKYLISLEGKPVAKDVLMDLFWPEADYEAARRNLHQAIYSLRQTLRWIQPDYAYVKFENNNYFLNPEMELWCDTQEFEQKVIAGRRLEKQGHLAEAYVEYGLAESIYLGDYLEEDLYDDWLLTSRGYLRECYMDISERLIEYHLKNKEYTAAISLSRKALNRDSCRERVHQLLIQCYLAQGQRHLALRQYHNCVQELMKELELEPAEATLALYPLISMAE